MIALVSFVACGEGRGPWFLGSTPTPTTSPTPTGPSPEQICSEALDPFLNDLQGINSRLNVGLTIGEYRTLLGDTQVTLDSLADDAFQLPCRPATNRAEGAFRTYVHALRIWDECLFRDPTFSCDTDDILPELQTLWRQAADKAETAEQLLGYLPG